MTRRHHKREFIVYLPFLLEITVNSSVSAQNSSFEMNGDWNRVNLTSDYDYYYESAPPIDISLPFAESSLVFKPDLPEPGLYYVEFFVQGCYTECERPSAVPITIVHGDDRKSYTTLNQRVSSTGFRPLGFYAFSSTRDASQPPAVIVHTQPSMFADGKMEVIVASQVRFTKVPTLTSLNGVAIYSPSKATLEALNESLPFGAVVNAIAASPAAWKHDPSKDVNSTVVVNEPSYSLFIGGLFAGQIRDSLFVNVIEYRDGMLYPLGNIGVAGRVSALAVTVDGDVYAGGAFTNLMDMSQPAIKNLAVYRGQKWYPMGHIDGPVASLHLDGQNLHVGGSFQEIIEQGGLRWSPYGSLYAVYDVTPGQRRWISQKMILEGSGVSAIQKVMSTEEEGYVVAGSFTRLHEARANGIVRFRSGEFVSENGIPWSLLSSFRSVSEGPVINAGVDFAYLGEKTVYIAGDFSSVEDPHMKNLAVRTSAAADPKYGVEGIAKWTAVANFSLNAPVRVLTVAGSRLWIGGDFDRAIRKDGGTETTVTMLHVGWFDGYNFHSAGSGLSGIYFL